MSRIAIMAAMPEELQALLDCMPDEHRVRHAGREFWLGHLVGAGRRGRALAHRQGRGRDHGGVAGQRAAAQEIVLTGVAGGLAEGVAVGDVVVGRQVPAARLRRLAHLPAPRDPVLRPLHVRPWPTGSPAAWRAAHEVLQAAAEHLGAPAVQAYRLAGRRCHEGLIVSGDRFVSTTAESAALHARTWASPLEMEGAAVAGSAMTSACRSA